MTFLTKFIDEVDVTVKQTHEFRSLIKDYKLATSKFSKSAEQEFLTNLKFEQKQQIFRDVSSGITYQIDLTNFRPQGGSVVCKGQVKKGSNL